LLQLKTQPPARVVIFKAKMRRAGLRKLNKQKPVLCLFISNN